MRRSYSSPADRIKALSKSDSGTISGIRPKVERQRRGTLGSTAGQAAGTRRGGRPGAVPAATRVRAGVDA
jgi:hypothetical protein